MHWLILKCYDQSQEPNPTFPLRAMVQDSIIKCWRQLYKTELPWIMKVNCNFKVAERKLRILLRIISNNKFLDNVSPTFFTLHIFPLEKHYNCKLTITKKRFESKYCTYIVIYHHPESPICLEGPKSRLHLYLDFIWTWSISGLYSYTQRWDLITQFIKTYTYKPEQKYIDLFLKRRCLFLLP